jgi:hypothetical protein
MPCAFCRRFPAPTSNFQELAVNVERHGTLDRCRHCGGCFEYIAEERSARFTPIDELKQSYPSAFAPR